MRTEKNRYEDMREILLYENKRVTLSNYFQRTFKILDRKDDLILHGPNR
jgi:hypothetical protein